MLPIEQVFQQIEKKLNLREVVRVRLPTAGEIQSLCHKDIPAVIVRPPAASIVRISTNLDLSRATPQQLQDAVSLNSRNEKSITADKDCGASEITSDPIGHLVSKEAENAVEKEDDNENLSLKHIHGFRLAFLGLILCMATLVVTLGKLNSFLILFIAHSLS
jgi:hypothetical protein